MLFAERKRKVGLVIGQLSHGGAERQAVLLAIGLKKYSNYEPVIFCLSNNTGPHGSSLKESAVEYYYFPTHTKNYIRKILWLIDGIKKAQCCLIYGILHVGNIYGGMAASLLRLPYLTSIRSANRALPFILRSISGFFSQRANCVVANSDSCVKSLRDDIGVTNPSVVNIPNAIEVDINNLTSFDRQMELDIPPDALVVGTVALLKAEKRPDFFIDVGLQILKENKCTYFVWVGDGFEKQRVLKIIDTLPEPGRNHFKFIGSRKDVWGYLKSFDLFLLTSEYEGMPNALLEAMSVGLPCVATDVVGTKDVLSAGNEGEEIGILASPSSPPEFADTVLELLTDPARMKRMGLSAQKHIQAHYSLKKMVLAHCDVFNEVLAFKNKRSKFDKTQTRYRTGL
jgi:glycosyltransferase involved in cell wall biosynthesis